MGHLQSKDSSVFRLIYEGVPLNSLKYLMYFING